MTGFACDRNAGRIPENPQISYSVVLPNAGCPLFQRMHFLVAKAEVMAEFVNYDVAHEIVDSQSSRPHFRKQWHSEKPDARRHPRVVPNRLIRKRQPLIEAGELPAVDQSDGRKLILGRKILDREDHVGAMFAETIRKSLNHTGGDFGEGHGAVGIVHIGADGWRGKVPQHAWDKRGAGLLPAP